VPHGFDTRVATGLQGLLEQCDVMLTSGIVLPCGRVSAGYSTARIHQHARLVFQRNQEFDAFALEPGQQLGIPAVIQRSLVLTKLHRENASAIAA